MANYCSNNIKVYGENKAIIETCLNQFKGKESGSDLFQNICSEEIIKKERENGNVLFDGRTAVYGIGDKVEKKGDLYYFDLWIESPWSPIIEDLNNTVHEYISTKISAVGTAEECGMEIYINTDMDGLFFDDRYGYDDFEGKFDAQNFSSEEDLVNYVNECWKKDFSSYDEIIEYLDDNDADWKVFEYTFCN